MASSSRWKFFPRLLKFRHLEFDSAFQQIAWTVVYPKRVFRYHQHQNETRGHWARDDPAFLLLLCLFLTVSSMCYGAWLHLHALGFLFAWLWTVLGDCLGSGVIVATALWVIAGRVLTRQPSLHRVEWAYCFDVHLNAFVPLALAIFGVQMVLWPLLSAQNIFSLLFANTLWLAAIAYYIYVTFLGYTVLPSSRHTTALLYTTLLPLFLYLFSLPLRWNFASGFGRFYAWRTGAQ